MVKPFDAPNYAAMCNTAGIELVKHGRRYGGAGLTLAIEAYEAALEVYTRADQAVQWAATQKSGFGI